MWIAVMLAALTTWSSLAGEKPEQDDVLAVVKEVNEAFNKGDSKAAIALSTGDMAIIDEIPPYEWHGPGAFAKWFDDYDAEARRKGITDGVVTLGKPLHVDVNGDRAYVVINADYTWKQNDTPQKVTNAVWTFALRKTAEGWRVAGWCWAKP
jgi:ketosteroid isomerase-like protein